LLSTILVSSTILRSSICAEQNSHWRSQSNSALQSKTKQIFHPLFSNFTVSTINPGVDCVSTLFETAAVGKLDPTSNKNKNKNKKPKKTKNNNKNKEFNNKGKQIFSSLFTLESIVPKMIFLATD
jgi:hypothetical protein